jgi:ABC-type multidrug transport system ATPase subunit
LMYAGKLVECDSPKRIREKLEMEIIEIQPEDWQKALKTVAGLRGVREAQTYGESIHLLVDSGERRLPEIERVLKENNLAYRSIRIAPARMEEAFISLIRKLEA